MNSNRTTLSFSSLRKVLLATLAAGVMLGGSACIAQPATAPASSDNAEYRKTIHDRAAKIVDGLKLDDAEKAAKALAILEDFYPAVSAWHDENDPKVKAFDKQINDATKAGDTAKADALRAEQTTLREQVKSIGVDLQTKLAAVLTPEQITAVKDAMTFNRYHQMTEIFSKCDLSMEQAQQVDEILKLAREEAVTAGSSEAKHAVFRRYIGRINTRVLTQAQRDKLAEVTGQKPKPTTQPAN